MSGMGATAADYDHTGALSIFRSNFSDERETMYRNRGKAEFEDVTSRRSAWDTIPGSSAGAAGSSISTTTGGRICCW